MAGRASSLATLFVLLVVPALEAGGAGRGLVLEPHIGLGATEIGRLLGVVEHRLGVALHQPAFRTGPVFGWSGRAGTVRGVLGLLGGFLGGFRRTVGLFCRCGLLARLFGSAFGFLGRCLVDLHLFGGCGLFDRDLGHLDIGLRLLGGGLRDRGV